MHQELPDSVEHFEELHLYDKRTLLHCFMDVMVELFFCLFVIVFQLTVLYLLYLAFILFVPFSFLKMCGGALTLSRSHLSNIDVA